MLRLARRTALFAAAAEALKRYERRSVTVDRSRKNLSFAI
jgi:hypothetical protein